MRASNNGIKHANSLLYKPHMNYEKFPIHDTTSTLILGHDTSLITYRYVPALCRQNEMPHSQP